MRNKIKVEFEKDESFTDKDIEFIRNNLLMIIANLQLTKYVTMTIEDIENL